MPTDDFAATVHEVLPGDEPASSLRLHVDHVSYNIGTVDSLDYNLRNCLPSHRDALLDARHRYYPDAPTEGWG